MTAAAATLGAARRMAAKRLAAGLGPEATPALDARVLVAAALGVPPDRLLFLPEDRLLSDAETQAVEASIERRLAGVPVARIVGEREFWGMSFRLSDATLVPRPDTETLVEAALAWIDREGRRQEPLRIVDIGTGSGAILIALLSALPNAVGIGVDLSEAAARTARDNAERLGFAERSRFVVGAWSNSCGRFDVIASNPPYIASDVIPTLDREVRDHDPTLALDGGADGLDAYRAILDDLERVMAPGGATFLEIGFDQADALRALARQAGFDASVHADLAGHDRIVELHRID
ncbi:release factor glutamine methyltransferase [Kaistia sp. 32K]|uniref:peptide chain release factor N(5)-glutamine methyltransferase n=1 Tax=Kaistia sp. 32K TaxID=2795690 RepID=UPI0019152EF4|nr:peptide chain release factor N(5)-glutamine methyltransferase [Kaistia sp. 32K]BCP55104.1 release factor glutamine methyltransferase [Kaistia sp. 32K]